MILRRRIGYYMRDVNNIYKYMKLHHESARSFFNNYYGLIG